MVVFIAVIIEGLIARIVTGEINGNGSGRCVMNRVKRIPIDEVCLAFNALDQPYSKNYLFIDVMLIDVRT